MSSAFALYPPNCPARPSRKRPRGLLRQRRVEAETSSRSRPESAASSRAPSAQSDDGRLSSVFALNAHALQQLDALHDPFDSDLDDDGRSDSSGASSFKRRCFSLRSADTDFTSLYSYGSCSRSGSATPISDPQISTPASDTSSAYNAACAGLRQPSPHLMSFSRPPTSTSLSPGPSEIARSISGASTSSQPRPHTAAYEDWENLKELFTRAAERYDADDIQEALPLLRAVMRECTRFLHEHADPSLVYANSETVRTSRSPDAVTPTEERFRRDWGSDVDPSPPYPQRRKSQHHRPAELPTAFHAIFGITMFLMGNLVAQDPSIVIPGEPDVPSTYWLAALDVFETGENLPSRTVGLSFNTAEDWRMAIVWGRTLVCLADEKVTYNMKLAQAAASGTNGSDYCYYPTSSPFPINEPKYPVGSPFHAIAQFRPPVTRRMSLYSASAHDIMVLAMDQFSRGIFHMPHPTYARTHNPTQLHLPGQGYFNTQHATSASGTSSPSAHFAGGSVFAVDPLGAELTFSRPKELFTIASEVLGVAERLAHGSERQYWASWADSVFNQMKNEADMDAWRGPILSARGRCWLIMGSAPVEEMEPALEAGDTEILHSAEAEEAREGLAMAISFFERAKGSATAGAAGGPDFEDVNPLLAEALLVLANLTADENKREELYARAQAEAGDAFALGLEGDVRGAEAAAAADEAMDTS